MSAEAVQDFLIRTATDQQFYSLFVNDPHSALAEFNLTTGEQQILIGGDQNQIRQAATVDLPSWWPGGQARESNNEFEFVGPRTRARPDVYLVGLGIVGCRQITVEAKQAIESCTRIYTLWNDPVVGVFLRQLNPNVIPLDGLYEPAGKDRCITYTEVATRILEAAASEPPVALAVYGHPLVLSSYSQLILNRALQSAITVRVVSGISSIDTILTDLRTDVAPALQIYDASALLAHKYTIDSKAACLIMQVESRDNGTYTAVNDASFLGVLKDYLSNFFSNDRPVVIVQCSTNPVADPLVLQVKLEDLGKPLSELPLVGSVSLYLPAVKGT